MKRLITAAFLATVGLVGCDKGTPGGPGTSNPNSGRGNISTADNTFTIDTPNFGAGLKQGEAKLVDFSIRRGTGFDQDVTLKFDHLPKGVSVDPASPMIKKGEKETKVTFKAADDAALGDAKVHVVGHPGTGADATNDFTLTVKQK